MTIGEITAYLETIAPPVLQEGYDNSGLIVGDKNAEATGALVCLDSIEEIVDEAIEKGCNLIIAHHPIVFSGLKKITGKNYIERTIIKAIKNDIAIYAIHTNLDNVQNGVNAMICKKLGLKNTRILAPKNGLLKKLYTFCPENHVEKVRHAIFNAGAGVIGNYDHCSFNISGTGTFRGGEDTDPFVGEKGKDHFENEVKIETIFPAYAQSKIIGALTDAHPYEEVAFDIIALDNSHPQVGAGMIGELDSDMDEMAFLKKVKQTFKCGSIRYTETLGKPVKKVAVCGGAGSFLLEAAIAAGANIFITGDFKYHQFFDTDGKIVIADIGHYESEQFTVQLLGDFLKEKFANFAVRLTGHNTNPINYI